VRDFGMRSNLNPVKPKGRDAFVSALGFIIL
jgi:hypothetical protein